MKFNKSKYIYVCFGKKCLINYILEKIFLCVSFDRLLNKNIHCVTFDKLFDLDIHCVSGSILTRLWHIKIFRKLFYQLPRTTDSQRVNNLHFMAENSIKIPNFQVRPKHNLSATSAQFFRYFWFMPSLGVRSPWFW